DLSIYELTTVIKKFIWPLVTHFPTKYLGLYYPIMDKIDFLDDVNWIDQFTLSLELDYQKDTIVSLGARTAKGKDLPTCECLNICTNHPYPNTPLESINLSKIYVVNLDGYLQPKFSNETDKVLTTKITLSAVVLVSYATFGLNKSVNVQDVVVLQIPHNYTIADTIALNQRLVNSYKMLTQFDNQLIKFYQQYVDFTKQSIKFYQQLLEDDKQLTSFCQQLTQFNDQLSALYQPPGNFNLFTAINPGKFLFNFSIITQSVDWNCRMDHGVCIPGQCSWPFSNLIAVQNTPPLKHIHQSTSSRHARRREKVPLRSAVLIQRQRKVPDSLLFIQEMDFLGTTVGS
ncbi:hypothetical protein NEHOM01_2360, partial [Nematocida homosporus]|uniref:uncharacterized protein n=1 Tax=Nematocida homosporus TaxID=1912981 RepID=UPI00221E3888